MRHHRGYALIDSMLVIAVITLLTASILQATIGRRLAAEEEVVMTSVQSLIHATRGYWSKYRVSPPSINALVTENLLGNAPVPTNPLGTLYTVSVVPGAGSLPQIIVTADITRPGALADWRVRLGANDVIPGGLRWRRYASEVSDYEGIRSEAFRAMY